LPAFAAGSPGEKGAGMTGWSLPARIRRLSPATELESWSPYTEVLGTLPLRGSFSALEGPKGWRSCLGVETPSAPAFIPAGGWGVGSMRAVGGGEWVVAASRRAAGGRPAPAGVPVGPEAHHARDEGGVEGPARDGDGVDRVARGENGAGAAGGAVVGGPAADG